MSDDFSNPNLAVARREFVRAIERSTPAWSDLLNRCQLVINEKQNRKLSLSASGGVETLALERVKAMLERGRVVAAEWTRQWHVDVFWMRIWAEFAAYDVLCSGGRIRSVDCLSILQEPLPGITDRLNADENASLFNEWLPDEVPPQPLELKKQFLYRMELVFDRRQQIVKRVLGGEPTKSSLQEHAEWTARFQVGKESVADISRKDTSDEKKACVSGILKFATTIDLPLRCRPR